MDGEGYDLSSFSFGAEIVTVVLVRLNSAMFYVLWTTAPILVSIISFFAFVMQGNELTVAIAFTVSGFFLWIRGVWVDVLQAIALFNMIRCVAKFLFIIFFGVVVLMTTGVLELR